MISCAVNTTWTACLNEATSKLPSSSRNFRRLRLARLQAELSRCMYSLHGFEALIRPEAGEVCQSLMVLSYCIPGSAHSQAAWATWRITSRARIVFSGSFEDRIRERLMPEPDPPLKIVPSSTYQLRIEDISSSTARMKHAEHCWGVFGTPTLNHTGELNAAFCVTRMWVSSSAKTSASRSEAKYPSLTPQPLMVSTTREISWRTLDSR